MFGEEGMNSIFSVVALATVLFCACNQVVWVEDGRSTDTGGERDTSPSGADSELAQDAGDFLCMTDGTDAATDRKISFVIAVDTSGGMEDEAVALQSSMNGFVDRLREYGMDPRIVLISAAGDAKTGICIAAPLGSGDCPEDSNEPTYRHVVEPVGSKDALTKITNTYDLWKDALHPTGPVVFVVLSDDDADLAAAEFEAGIAAPESPVESFFFYAIAASSSKADACAVSEEEACCLFGVNEGTVYRTLAESTDGLVEDICAQNIEGALERFALDAAEKSCEGIGVI